MVRRVPGSSPRGRWGKFLTWFSILVRSMYTCSRCFYVYTLDFVGTNVFGYQRIPVGTASRRFGIIRKREIDVADGFTRKPSSDQRNGREQYRDIRCGFQRRRRAERYAVILHVDIQMVFVREKRSRNDNLRLDRNAVETCSFDDRKHGSGRYTQDLVSDSLCTVAERENPPPKCRKKNCEMISSPHL